jgi:hypothetical protein
MNRILLVVLAALAAALTAPAAAASANDASGPERVYFAETGHYLGGDFLVFWREYGGIRTFGYPLTPEIQQGGLTVQYFERHVLEYHPDNPADYRVLLRRIGVEARDDRGLESTGPFQLESDDGSGRFFAATGHSMKDGFLNYWESHGGTRIFGYPISAQFGHRGMVVQFTERAIFEFHPDNPPGWRILFERLGADAAKRDGVDTSPREHDGSTPHFHEGLWQATGSGSHAGLRPPSLPSQLRIDKLGIVSSFEHVGLTASGAMAAPYGWNNVAWYQRGAIPGEPGNAVVAGHLDAPGGVPAIFWNLRYLVPGDRVTVITEAGYELVFQVTRVEQVYVNNAPMSEIFGITNQRNLNLITCAGFWNSSMGMYDQRLIVYTTLISD